MYKVLMIDADVCELNTLSAIIDQDDCGLEVVGLLSDSCQARCFLKENSVDILIMNIRLPEMDGIELLQEFRSCRQDVRCIFMASKEDIGYVQKVIPMGIENFLLKPVDPQILLETLHSTIQKINQVRTQKTLPANESHMPESDPVSCCGNLPMLTTQNLEKLVLYQEHAQCHAHSDKNMRFSPCIARAVAHIEKNYAHDISLKSLAYELNINAAYLGQLFKSETGQLFSTFLNKTRIENAKKMLLNTRLTHSEISRQCGYTNTSYFYNMFKKCVGQTPSQYRKSKAK